MHGKYNLQRLNWDLEAWRGEVSMSVLLCGWGTDCFDHVWDVCLHFAKKQHHESDGRAEMV